MSNSSSPSPTSSPTESTRRRTSWIVWLWFWITIGLVAIVQIPKEITAWKYAAALEAREAGDKARGYQLLEEAIARNTDKQWYQENKYSWLKEDERFAEALTLLESGDTVGMDLLQERSQLLLHLQRYPEAVKDCERIRQASEATGRPSAEQSRNYLAYARALGKIDLEQASADMDAVVATTTAELGEAVEDLESSRLPRWLRGGLQLKVAVWKQRLGAFLDTRGFVRYQLGQFAAAEEDLNQAVKLVEPEVNDLLSIKSQLVKRSRNEREAERKYLAEARQTLAVLVYHRGLNRQKLGREVQAKQDFARVRELIGKEPDESLF